MRRLALLGALALPAPALAGNIAFDLTRGPAAQLLGTTSGLAWSLLGFFFLLALLQEAFGTSPVGARDYAGCVWRAIVALVVLRFYGVLVGSVFNLTQGIAERLTPELATLKFGAAAKLAFVERMSDVAVTSGAAQGSTSAPGMGFKESVAAAVGGQIFDAIVHVLMLGAELSHWVVARTGTLSAVTLYILGPLAVVASIPRGSGVGGAWFRTFLTFACWPILSGLLLQLTLSVGLDGSELKDLSNTTGALAISLVLAGSAVMVPKLASLLIGAASPDLAGSSLLATKAMALKAAVIAKTGGGAAVAGHVARGAARGAVRRP